MSRLRTITIADVAQQAGVAKATVSMVMRNKPGISEATRRRVFEVVRRLDYRPVPQRQTRGRVHYGQICLLLVTGEKPRLGAEPGGGYLHRMLDGCLSHAEAAGWGVIVAKMTTSEMEAGKVPAALSQRQIDGMLVRSPVSEALLQQLRALEVPYVLIDCDRYMPSVTQVQIENIQAMGQLIEHLIAVGSQRIATITGDMDHISAQERLAGLQMALGRHGCVLDPQGIVYEHGFDEASGHRGVETLLQRHFDFDTLVCQNDLIALGALRAFRGAGRSVPQDVRVAGFDNMEFCTALDTPLTSVDSRSDSVGQTGTRLLLEMIESGENRQLHVKIIPELIIRASTASTTDPGTGPRAVAAIQGATPSGKGGEQIPLRVG